MKNLTFLSLCLVALGLCTQTWAQETTTKSNEDNPLFKNLSKVKGPFEGNDKSLSQYKYPKWFRDAKFGVWAHWGPQAVPRQGDWYARKMYLEYNYKKRVKTDQKEKCFVYHRDHYGPQSKVGYKDIIKKWKAEHFDPDSLMRLYKKIGAKYFVSMGAHHDNFFLWNSKIHKWNAVNMGPHRDIVAAWQKAAKREGLPFGLSEHLGASYTWWQPTKTADKTGKYKGIPYDTNDPQYEDLYQMKLDPSDKGWYTTNPICQLDWYSKIYELITLYKPDLLYSDGPVAFDYVGKSIIADLYNQKINAKGETEAVYNCKESSNHRFVRDMERGSMDKISPLPWQTDTSIGNWFYCEGQGYKTATQIAQMLVDIVSKNGNLLLNIVQTPEGDLEDDVMKIVNEFGIWMHDNSEGIYGTRPWSVYGEGPSTLTQQEKGSHGGIKDVRPYASTDLRFTQKENKLYTFVMEHPKENIVIKALKANQHVKDITMLGTNEPLTFKQDAQTGTLTIDKPNILPAYAVTCYRITFE